MYVAVQLQQTTYSVEIKVDKVALLFILQLHHDLVIFALKVVVYVIFTILIHRLSSIFISIFFCLISYNGNVPTRIEIFIEKYKERNLEPLANNHLFESYKGLNSF